MKRLLLIIVAFVTVLVLSPSCSNEGKKRAIGVITRLNDYYSTHVITPDLCGNWVAKDGSRVTFYSNGEVSFSDFIQYRDSLIERLSDEVIDSLRQAGYHVGRNRIEVSDTIHSANGTWDCVLGHISCRSEERLLGENSPGLIVFSYRRRILPPHKIKYIYHCISDPDEARYHKFYKE